MPNLVTFVERNVKAKGIDKNNVINEEKVKSYFYDEDYENLKLLDKVELSKLSAKNPKLFYPGCGSDVLLPLHYVEKLFPQTKKIHFFFIDSVENFGLIKTVLDDVGVCFSEDGNRISFYWKKMLIELEFKQEDVFSLPLPAFDIYFEKAFRIMKDQDPTYESRIYEKLNKNGILISDSGFQTQPLQKIPITQELSSYKEMIIGVKK